MMLISEKIKNKISGNNTKKPAEGYDLWSDSYDAQPDNLMLALDEEIFGAFLKDKTLTGKSIVDVGCGTGRHWQKILDAQPSSLIGYDVSPGMLKQLQKKFPASKTFLTKNSKLDGLADNSCDIIISTLTLAHIENIADSFNEWNRILKSGGEIILTDYHPDMFKNGADRSFKHDSKLVTIENNVHLLAEIFAAALGLKWSIGELITRIVDNAVKHFYEKQNALHIFERYEGLPLIYGLTMKK